MDAFTGEELVSLPFSSQLGNRGFSAHVKLVVGFSPPPPDLRRISSCPLLSERAFVMENAKDFRFPFFSSASSFFLLEIRERCSF